MFEVITSEASYYNSLNVLVQHFYRSPEFDCETAALQFAKPLQITPSVSSMAVSSTNGSAATKQPLPVAEAPICLTDGGGGGSVRCSSSFSSPQVSNVEAGDSLSGGLTTCSDSPRRNLSGTTLGPEVVVCSADETSSVTSSDGLTTSPTPAGLGTDSTAGGTGGETEAPSQPGLPSSSLPTGPQVGQTTGRVGCLRPLEKHHLFSNVLLICLSSEA
ncbi:unnamed protein product [Protopolystoma xenopodis]|uniref:DH domain-containing protein n=1 Tax=Protopolystoma xenopodis TaxID=117903 RepID=A0A3S5C353_9PLAT|nr:unnamed protein product [Protopolystoma xenopodis]